MRLILYSFITLFLFAGCSGKKNNDSYRMSRLYVDLLITGEKSISDSSANVDSVFNLYGVTKTEYENYMRSLRGDKEKWEDFFNSAQRYLDTLKAASAHSSLPKQSGFPHK
jgi:hypothetical protein